MLTAPPRIGSRSAEGDSLNGYVRAVTVRRLGSPTADIRDARRLFPATANRAYFNTAAVGLASGRLAETYHRFIDEWATVGLDFPGRSGQPRTHDQRSPG